jgi:ABC-type antimicrobial peptide transport system permease subunit
MNLWESISVSLEGLTSNKMRSALTMLGVIIGVSAVIMMLAIGQGTRKQMMERIQQMGTNVLTVFSGQSRAGAVRGGFGSMQTLTLDDVEAIQKQCPLVDKTAPEVRSNAQVKYRSKNTNTTILGTTSDYPSVRNYSVQEGRFLSESDVKSLRKVAVIGATTADDLFGKASPVGKDITIKGTRFSVVGLMAVKGAGGFGDPDDQIFIPISTAMNRLFGLQYVRTIGVQARTMAQMDQASEEISALLRKRHRLAQGADDDFIIRNQADIMEMANATADTFTMLLAGIASVSLLVGGIGIMNIMLVSVTERTREIGIRMALGARRRDIQMQFLVEALVLSLLGGMLGILMGLFGSRMMQSMAGMSAVISPSSVVLSFGFAALVGVFFGYYPARKASRQDPIEALRYE